MTDGQTDGRTDRHTDKRTSCDGIVRAMHTRREVKRHVVNTPLVPGITEDAGDTSGEEKR